MRTERYDDEHGRERVRWLPERVMVGAPCDTSILNTARSGRFSSDRGIREYARDIWRIEPMPIRLLAQAQVKAGVVQ